MNTEEIEDPFDYVNGNYCKMRPHKIPIPEYWSEKQKIEYFDIEYVQHSLITGRIKVKVHYDFMSESERELLKKVVYYSDINHYISNVKLKNNDIELVDKIFVLDEEGKFIISELKNKIQNEYN